MQNFRTLGQALLGEKNVIRKKRKKKKNNPKNSGHYIPLQRLRAAHTLAYKRRGKIHPVPIERKKMNL